MEAYPGINDLIERHPGLAVAAYLGGVVLLSWLSSLLAHRLLVRLAARLIRSSRATWDDAIVDRRVIHRLANLVPALVVYLAVPLVPGVPASLVVVTRNVALAFMILTIALAISALFAALNDIYLATDRARTHPIKGYLQVAQIIIFVISTLLMIAVLIERSPLLLLSGFGAMTAVLMLVFKDTILSLVASVQLTTNDMLRVGDWIEMPQLGADGDVIDIALHTVKVQNWDKTITTIPTHRLISESYRNWRGMENAGGRRIKRAIHLDQTAIRYLTPEERVRMSRVSLLAGYIASKQAELEAFNASLTEQGQEPVNTRRLTNIGTFRAYVEAYLKHHPRVHQGLTLLVRQQPPGPAGLPIEIYCFTNTVKWAEYEAIQSDIFDHLLAVVPEFGLRVFQQPTGADIERGIAGVSSTHGRTATMDASANLG
ncbi:MAG TPA: mechanosensitive ion channel domain-containing protein [Thermoanaerobaculia bacterium]|nr:mechanosensitive ion channel domain-containing protein [Thermoanaerobaculia bacterium]